MATVNEEPRSRKEHGRWQTHHTSGSPLDLVLSYLQQVRKSGKEYSALCPAHEDKDPSLTITEAADGKVLLHCFAGCSAETIATAIGLTLADLFPRKEQSSRIVATYDYVDEAGTLLSQVVREHPKTFKQRRPDGKGGWMWNLDGVRRVLYRLPDLLTAEVVFIPEGEKDVDTLRAWGLTATCPPMGAGKGKWRDEYSPFLAGKYVIILPDNDAPGEEHALQVARALLPVAATVQVVRLPDLPNKGDVTDWKNAGHTKAELFALVEAEPLWTEEEQQQHTKWPEPGKIPDGLLPVPSMVAALIPEPFRPWLVDIAERMQCPLDFPVMSALASVAGVVGRHIGIRPKQQDDWLVIPNLWGAVIGRPGLMKTPALAEPMRPLNRLIAEAQAEYDEAMAKFPAAQMMAEAKRDALKRKINASLKDDIPKKDTPKNSLLPPKPQKEPLTVEEIAKELEEYTKASHPPIQRRYLVNDSTVEKLGELLNQNPNGVLLFRDELTGWLRMLDREGHQNDRAFYNECWNGSQSYTYDRIERGTLYIRAACLSLLGGIQPGPLAVYLRSAMQGGSDDDGLMQRLQLLVYPDDPGEWRNVDRWPDAVAKNRAFEIFQQLAVLDPATLGAHVEEDEVPYLRFAPDAQELFNEWRTDLERKLRSRDEHPSIESHLSKYRSLMPSLALLFHLISCVDEGTAGPVSLTATHQAAAWCDYLEAHARRVYQAVTHPAVFATRLLADKIEAKALPSPFTVREVVRKAWTGLTTLEEVRDAVEMLEDLNWLRSERPEVSTKGGRPRILYYINPAFPPKEEQ